MADITHGTWIKDGKAVDAVYQNGVKVYGRNLLTGTHSDWQSYTGTGWLNNNTFTLTTDNLDANTNYTFSVQIKSATGTWHGEVVAIPSNGGEYIIGDAIAVSNGTTTSTFNISNISSIVSLEFRPHVSSSILSTDTTVQWRHEKLEKGSVATPYSPAPEDILN